ncbi:glycine--tRNA ligase subunit beta [Lawsonia intracellularis]|uniref:glycine--tRNA ligase subunit beta n=1 Tax=Lawsonia intracellularis TaxID=29546 RepID=UPI0021E58E0B|nr:glycine--tRNA ligase subunit beta [Lawsonia intracellularis]UYH53222.1 glycine--tRNA ligase subunit beta [Lawsonia intracellularis]
MATFILEIGTEELPARFLLELQSELGVRFLDSLQSMGYRPTEVSDYSTPRRLVVCIKGLDMIQPHCEEVVIGPPINIAFDKDGNPTKAAEGFAKNLGITIGSLSQISTDRGEYISGLKVKGGIPTKEVLARLCPEIITALPLPKRMRWGNNPFTFIRPIRWIMALLDSDIVPFELAGIHSNRNTVGLRNNNVPFIEVPSSTDYYMLLKEVGNVILDPNSRKDSILQLGNKEAQLIGGVVNWNERLLNEVIGLVEHPYPLLGTINSVFLNLPREVLLTSIETHQKSFGILDSQGNLLPYFLTVLNMTPPDLALVKQGWERVLQARLEDARFFWNEDINSSFDEWQEKLTHLIFLDPLGSIAQKEHRVSLLCEWIAKYIPTSNAEEARKAGSLSKVDLVSKMVEEFPELQGVMGGIYARHKGESESIATAIAEQYLPSGPDTDVPVTDLGAILSIADKIDTLVGCFGCGIIPTGTADPYGLRRCALGIIRILIEKEYPINLHQLYTRAQDNFVNVSWKLAPEDVLQKLHEFIIARLKNYFLALGYDTLVVEAIVSTQTSQLWSIKDRLDSFILLSQHEDFSQLVQTIKRVINIIKKQDKETEIVLTGHWNPSLFKDTPEKVLAEKLMIAVNKFNQESQTASLPVFMMLLKLQPAINTFFDQVMIMSNDIEVRRNRLNLLKALLLYIESLADFSVLQI